MGEIYIFDSTGKKVGKHVTGNTMFSSYSQSKVSHFLVSKIKKIDSKFVIH